MKNTRSPLLRPALYGLVLTVAALALSGYVAKATPYASCITNSGNNYTFYLNEPGGNVTIVYTDTGTTNTSFNGVTTGTNLPAGPQTFSLSGHTSYEIIVNKVGSGTPSIITTIARGTARGIAANVNGASPYFGYVYSVIGGAGVCTMQSDGSAGVANEPFAGTALKPTLTGGAWGTSASAQYRIAVAPDDYVIVSDNTSTTEGGLIRVNPTFTAAEVLLAGQNPIGSPANHGSAESAGILTAPIGSNPILYVVDGSGFPPYNQIVTYNLGTATYANSQLPWTAYPNSTNANVQSAPNCAPTNNILNLSGDGADYGFYAGLCVGTGLTNGAPYTNVYVANERGDYSAPELQAYDSTGSNLLWSSWYPSAGSINYEYDGVNYYPISDYILTGTGAVPETGSQASDMALSPDGTTLAIVHIDNHITLLKLTNGIPDLSTLQVITGLLGTTGNGRGIGWDAAGNIWLTSSGLGSVYLISLGKTATAVTTGNTTSPQSFGLIVPATVSVTAANNSAVGPVASQQPSSAGNPASDTFTLTRSGGTTNQSLTVTFTLTGTATNVANYTTTAASTVTFQPNALSTNITITAVNGSTPLPTLFVTLNIQGSPVVNLGSPASATIAIVNTATPLVFAAVGVPSVYNALSNDWAAVSLTRWGDTNTSFTVSSYTHAGTAQVGQDYTDLPSQTFNAGDVSYLVPIYPLIGGNPPTHALGNPYVGNKTAVIGVSSGSGYSVNATTATLTIVDSANPAATVLFSDPLTNALDTGSGDNGVGNDGYAQWWTTYANDNMDFDAGPDYDVEFGYQLSSGSGEYGLLTGFIPPPPNGSPYALRVTCNKILGLNAGVNVYPTNVSFSGNIAIRFNMNFVQEGDPSYQTEGVLFGMNHAGVWTNWWSGGLDHTPTNSVYPWTADGVWCWVNGGPGSYGGGDYTLFTGITNSFATNNTGWKYIGQTYAPYFTNFFKFTAFGSVQPPYTGLPDITADNDGGVPVNSSQVTVPANNNIAATWCDVELKQVGSNVTFSINKAPIFTYVNTNSLFSSGTVMFGYNDPYSSKGNADGAAYFSNLQVVRLGEPDITAIATSGANVDIKFSITDGDYTTLTVQSAGVVTGPYSNVAGATITSLGSGAFQAVVPQSGGAQFYRIAAH